MQIWKGLYWLAVRELQNILKVWFYSSFYSLDHVFLAVPTPNKLLLVGDNVNIYSLLSKVHCESDPRDISIILSIILCPDNLYYNYYTTWSDNLWDLNYHIVISCCY